MSAPKYKKGESVYLAIPEYYTVEGVDVYDEGYVYRLRGLDNDLIHVEEEKMEEYKVCERSIYVCPTATTPRNLKPAV